MMSWFDAALAAADGSVLSGSRDLAIYGAGNAGKDLLRALRSHGMNVRCLIDRRAAPGMAVDGVPVLPLAEAAALHRDARVVLGIFSGYTDVHAVDAAVRQAGFAESVSFCAIYPHLQAELGSRYFLSGRELLSRHRTEIAGALDGWADERSREEFRRAIEFRVTGELSHAPRPVAGEVQYFPSDVPGWKPPRRFIDCGAFDGDTVASLAARVGPIESLAAFEPDGSNFAALSRSVREHPVSAEAFLFPCGVHRETTKLSFATGAGASSRADERGQEVVQVVSLDDAVPGFRPDLIKMDIEGAEIDALRGAEGLIRSSRPSLAICTYHTPSHIWELPSMILSWGLGYRLFLRTHGYQSFEMVLYAIP